MKTSRGRILAVDDDPAMLRTVERILAGAHDVRSAASGEEALRLLRQEPCDVAIIDIRMPGMDGYAVTRAIKEIRPATEVILVTGSVSDLDEKLSYYLQHDEERRAIANRSKEYFDQYCRPEVQLKYMINNLMPGVLQ